MKAQHLVLRLAREGDIEAVQALQRNSLGALTQGFYSPRQIAAAVAYVPLTDAALIAEGHFFVLEEPGFGLVATGGWSLARPTYEAFRSAVQDGSAEATAKVRHIFVHPERARRGLGSRVMRSVEADAAAAGQPRLAMAATLSGVPLYRKIGYAETGDAGITLPGGVHFPLVAMAKALKPTVSLAA
jgi:GNAT superfamily N-acetyltransferase